MEVYDQVVKFASSHKRLIGYLAMGVTALLADYSTFFILFEYGHLSIFIANTSGLLIGFLVSFTGNRIFVFQVNSNNSHHSTTKQIAMYAILLFFNTMFSYGVISNLQRSGDNTSDRKSSVNCGDRIVELCRV